ncbi:hypothetical protein [Pedobacter sandarakinus]|uniref:hypothetical protein n=1 Tax=Pedobacter sandarakinus TaxID=353156 RepID=UPI002245D87B|nr:hypothetical protein [Pedobacter sandarakinus]MCX2575911.1 hypothetical protein [Pedobacter sandarakinus]
MKVSLQINVAPGDYPLVEHLLPHQLRLLSSQVDEVVITLETKPSKGRFGQNWSANKDKLDALLTEIAKQRPIKIIPVDYSKSAKKAVASYFFGLNSLPDKDHRGGPFFSYFFGLHACTNDLVLHLDADMFLGGKSITWITEAETLFATDGEVFTVSPLPGPPTADQSLTGQQIIHQYTTKPYMFELGGFSTRIFMIKKSVFQNQKLKLGKPSFKNQLKALWLGNSTADLPEHLVEDFMKQKKLKRIDFLGENGGMWSLHPPYRTELFYSTLPKLIHKVEHHLMPYLQFGFYDIVDDLFDWTEAKRKLKIR